MARVIKRKGHSLKVTGDKSIVIEGWWSGELKEMHEFPSDNDTREINCDEVSLCADCRHDACIRKGQCDIMHNAAWRWGTNGARSFLKLKGHGDITPKMLKRIKRKCAKPLKKCRRIKIIVSENGR